MQSKPNNVTFFQCVKLLADANIDLIRKSTTQHQCTSNNDLEIFIFTCASVIYSTSPNTKDKEIKALVVDALSWLFNQHFSSPVPRDYFEKRLSEYVLDIEQCKLDNLALPLYSYYSIFKSPLVEFELQKITDYDIFELSKFKMLILHLEEMNAKSAEFLTNLVN